MLLEKLTILSKAGIIRDIPFNLQGLNLIVDTTPISILPDENLTISGNNVGKTTFIRCIDFCFGSTGKDIYQNKEQKNDDEEIKQFLVNNEVSFILSLLKSDSTRIQLKRSFNKDEDLIINNEKISSLINYNNKLNELLFHIKPEERKISFRNIIKKFVRSDSNSNDNLIKILHSNVKDIVYEALFLKLFGFPDDEVLSTRLKLSDKIQNLKNDLRKIKGITSLPKLQSRLVQLEKGINEMESKIKDFNLPKTYDDLLNQLNNYKSQTADLSSLIGTLNTKISLSIQTRDDLIHSESTIDPTAISELYKEAQTLLPNLEKSFAQVLDFHNKMIKNRIKFVQVHISNLEFERTEKQSLLVPLLQAQARILRTLDNTGTFDDLLKVRQDVNALYVDKGKLEGQIEYIENIQNEIKISSNLLNEINVKFETYLDNLNNNIQNIFNKYFKQYTSLTHGEQLYIYYDSEKGKFEFDNIGGNVGEGYKKTEIIAFDMAFISFFNELGYDFPQFVIHDKLEIVHRNQIETTFKIAELIDGQFVVSVLKQSVLFLGEDFINKNKILELSQTDKLFRF